MQRRFCSQYSGYSSDFGAVCVMIILSIQVGCICAFTIDMVVMMGEGGGWE